MSSRAKCKTWSLGSVEVPCKTGSFCTNRAGQAPCVFWESKFWASGTAGNADAQLQMSGFDVLSPFNSVVLTCRSADSVGCFAAPAYYIIYMSHDSGTVLMMGSACVETDPCSHIASNNYL